MILNFDANEVEIVDSFELIPDNTEATAIIQSTEWKETKDGTGGYLKLKIEIIDGIYKGRLLFDNLNLQNKNEKAVSIAQQTLAKICLAVNKPKVQTSEELLNIPLKVKIGVSKQDGYEPLNKIKSYTSTKETKKEDVAPTQSSGSVPPWKQGK